MLKHILLAILLLLPTIGQTKGMEDYIKSVYDSGSKHGERMTRSRARMVAVAIEKWSLHYGIPVDIAVGLVHWESDHFANHIEKEINGRPIPIPHWSFGYCKVKVSTAKWQAELEGMDHNRVNGRELIYDIDLNIHLGMAYLRWMLEMKDWNLTRALNGYQLGHVGERNKSTEYAKNVMWRARQYGRWARDNVSN
jgi:hypothetical protein